MKTLKIREKGWVKNVQFWKRQEKKAKTHGQAQRAREKRRHAVESLAKIRAQIKAQQTPMRLRALREAAALVGVVEKGGNNMGPLVSQIIHANGGPGPEPWCGDFVAWCYRKAGSKMVTRGWAAVSILGWLTGMKVLRAPVPGCIVIYNFSHTGLYVKSRGPGQFEAIEGNTGSSGAVSDSHSGQDGVKRKVRSTSLVTRYVLPTR